MAIQERQNSSTRPTKGSRPVQEETERPLDNKGPRIHAPVSLMRVLVEATTRADPDHSSIPSQRLPPRPDRRPGA
jgi:hypothetical protein